MLYRAPISAYGQMRQSTPEQQKAGMEAWMAWAGRAGAALVDLGAPLGKGIHVTGDGASASPNDLGGYSVMQGESADDVARLLDGHPHLGLPGGFIEVIEIVPIPGM